MLCGAIHRTVASSTYSHNTKHGTCDDDAGICPPITVTSTHYDGSRIAKQTPSHLRANYRRTLLFAAGSPAAAAAAPAVVLPAHHTPGRALHPASAPAAQPRPSLVAALLLTCFTPSSTGPQPSPCRPLASQAAAACASEMQLLLLLPTGCCGLAAAAADLAGCTAAAESFGRLLLR